MHEICADYLEIISKVKKRIDEYEKHACGNTQIIQEIINEKDYLEEIEETYHQLVFIKSTVEDLEIDDYFGFEGVYVNID